MLVGGWPDSPLQMSNRGNACWRMAFPQRSRDRRLAMRQTGAKKSRALPACPVCDPRPQHISSPTEVRAVVRDWRDVPRVGGQPLAVSGLANGGCLETVGTGLTVRPAPNAFRPFWSALSWPWRRCPVDVAVASAMGGGRGREATRTRGRRQRRADDGAENRIEGAMRIVAIEQDHFEISDFTPAATVRSDPESLTSIYPAMLIPAIRRHADAN